MWKAQIKANEQNNLLLGWDNTRFRIYSNYLQQKRSIYQKHGRTYRLPSGHTVLLEF